MPQPFALPLANHMLALLIAAAVLPLVFGVLARAFFFRRDVDDARRDPLAARAAERALTELQSPEPEPRYRQPWPGSPSGEDAHGADEAAPGMVADPLARSYEVRGTDLKTLEAELNAVWRELRARLRADPRARALYHWPSGYDPESAPYWLSLEPAPQGHAMTLSVGPVIGGGFGVDLMLLWETEVRPALEERLHGALRG